MLVQGFHVITLAVQAYSLTWDIMYLTDPKGNKLINYRGFPGKFKYLTFWCQLLQGFYFALACLNDLCGSSSRPGQTIRNRSYLQKFRDIVLTALAFPIGLFVVVTFWGLYAIDRELVFPKALDAIFPPWLNHIMPSLFIYIGVQWRNLERRQDKNKMVTTDMHTTVIVFLLIEKVITYHPYPSRRKGLLLCLAFACSYQLWIFWIAFHANIWVYPVLAVMPWSGRFAFLAICWVVIIAFYLLGECITNTVWGVYGNRRVRIQE